jgi:dihydropteroate synthase
MRSRTDQSAPEPRGLALRLRGQTLQLSADPLLMGIVNTGPDSFSDPGRRAPARLVERAREQASSGAALIDVGGESGRTDRPPVTEREEVARVVPVIEPLAAEGLLVSVDTWRASVARAALAAGAAIVNDVSGLADPLLAEACAEVGAGLVITHTRTPPKRKRFPRYSDVVEDIVALLGERAEEAIRRGVAEEQLVFDPGIDLAKTPAQSIEVIRRLDELRALGRPLLVAVSRKDFVGALTGQPPGQRLAGSLAALAEAVDRGAAILRVHDVAAARDYLCVRAALRGERPVPAGLRLRVGLRREPEAPMRKA